MEKIKKTCLIIGIWLFCLSAHGQKNGTIYTDKDIQKVIADNPDLCNCPPPVDRVVVSNRGSSEKLSLMLSGGLNYFYGNGSGETNDFNSDYGSWYGEIMLGYTYQPSGGGNGTTLGVFGKVGNTPEAALDKLWLDAGLSDAAPSSEDQNLFYGLEGGAILFELLRISTGIGVQEYRDNANELARLNYYSTTAGLQIGSRNFRILVDANFIYGRDLEETLLRPQVGLGVQF